MFRRSMLSSTSWLPTTKASETWDSSSLYFSTKPGSIETKSTLVVEVSNVKFISI
jgi:hypothetical protein